MVAGQEQAAQVAMRVPDAMEKMAKLTGVIMVVMVVATRQRVARRVLEVGVRWVAALVAERSMAAEAEVRDTMAAEAERRVSEKVAEAEVEAQVLPTAAARRREAALRQATVLILIVQQIAQRAEQAAQEVLMAVMRGLTAMPGVLLLRTQCPERMIWGQRKR